MQHSEPSSVVATNFDICVPHATLLPLLQVDEPHDSSMSRCLGLDYVGPDV